MAHKPAKPVWDEDRFIAIIDRMRTAYDAGELEHALSFAETLELVTLEEIGDVDKVFDLLKKIQEELKQEIKECQSQSPLKGKLQSGKPSSKDRPKYRPKRRPA